MGLIFKLICVLFLVKQSLSLVNGQEPNSCSSFELMQTLTERIVRMEMKLEELQRQIKQTELEQSELSAPKRKVAFRAFLTSDTVTVKNGDVIKFDEVQLNLGSAYNSKTGIFAAPYDGLYQFSMELGNPPNTAGAIFLMKNEKVIEFAWGGHASGGWTMGGVSTVAQLKAGDEIWVAGEAKISGSIGTQRYHTGFSGVLIQAD